MYIDNLFDEKNPKCIGCSILATPTKHSIMDYEDKDPVDVLFVSDSLKLFEGDFVPFRVNEYNLIKRSVENAGYTGKLGFTASVKCPSLKKDDIQAKDRKICRSHLIDSILQYKPKLVFACGDLPTVMFHGKNVKQTEVLGKALDFEMGGHHFKLVSNFHPYQVIAEPKNGQLFHHYIKLNIDTYILGVEKKSNFKYREIWSIEDLNTYGKVFLDTYNPVSCDIETTGLNFLTDVINSISFSLLDPITCEPIETISIPWNHKHSKTSLEFKAALSKFTATVLANPNNTKIGQNFKFDMKFLIREGIADFKNVYDTKLMQHLIQEDVPKRLSDLVNYYFPNEI